MAIDHKKISILLSQINNITSTTTRVDFKNYIGEIFRYLKSEISNNPVYNKYESEVLSHWPDGQEVTMGFSYTKTTDSKAIRSLSYSVYKSIHKNPNYWNEHFMGTLTGLSAQHHQIVSLNAKFFKTFSDAIEDILNAIPDIGENRNTPKTRDTIFIIHGHDRNLKVETQLLLNRAGLHCVVLHEKSDRGRTIIDKLIQETDSAGYGIALLTPDDLTHDGNNRARQNVILEIGYFLGKLGKERLRMIVKGDIEIPSDLQGILYEKYNDIGSWKIKLIKEIQAVGIQVDLQSVLDQF